MRSPDSDWMASEFRFLLRGHSPSDVDWLLNLQRMQQHVYIYDFHARCAFHPSGNQIAWPILYLLSRHHKSYRRYGSRIPDLQQVAEAMKNFSNRIRWKIHFHQTRGPQSSESRVFNTRYAGKACAAYHHTPIPEAEAWLQGLNNAVFGRCKRMLHRSHRNTSPGKSNLLRFALKLFRQSDWCAWKTDKDGGFGVFQNITLSTPEGFLIRTAFKGSL